MNELNNPADEVEGEFEKQEVIEWDSLDVREYPVKIKNGPDAGDYVIIEASAEDAKKWRANNLRALQMQEKGTGKNRSSTSSFDGDALADSHILLVSMCLFKVDPSTGNRTPVKADTIRKNRWPNRFVEQVFRKAQALSALRDDDESPEEPGKNSSSGADSPRLSVNP